MTSKRRESRSGGEPPRTRRRFTQEFKLEAVRLASSGVRRPAEVARELGIRADMLRQWRLCQAEARAGSPLADVFPGSGTLMSQDEEIRRLRRQVAQLREERDIPGKSDGLLRQGRATRFAFIQAHAIECAIGTMCRVLGVSKAGYCAWGIAAAERARRAR